MAWDPKVECLGMRLDHCSYTITSVWMETVNLQTWRNWNFLFNGGEVLDAFLPSKSQHLAGDGKEGRGDDLRTLEAIVASPSCCADILEGKKY